MRRSEAFALVGWVLAAIHFGRWQHSADAGFFMLWIVFCYRWNRGNR